MHDLENACKEYIQAFRAYKSNWNLQAWNDLIESFMGSMRIDIEKCLQGAQLETFSRCLVRMIDIGSTDAIVTDRGIDGVKLPGFLVLPNVGLYFLFRLLITAQIFEDLRGDFEQYNRSGAEVFRAALHLYVSESPEKIFTGSSGLGSVDVDDVIAEHVSLGSVLLMEFVILHEIGHAHLGHAELLDQSRYNALICTGMESELGVVSNHHHLEYEADAFAWQALTHRANDPLKSLGNMYVIRLYFGFLDRIETTIGRPICKYHPSPQLRLQRLLAEYASDGLTVDAEREFERQDLVLDKWLKTTFGEAYD